MRKEIRETDDKGIVRITTSDERWYWRALRTTNEATGLPEVKNVFVPSVTWITSFYPKGIGFYKWLANLGWDEAEAVKQAAGDKGSKVHAALEDLIAGKEVRLDSRYKNQTTEQEEELAVDEYEALLSFARWYEKTKPEFLANEIVAISEQYHYAGTIDLLCRINGETYIVDFKTSQNVWTEYHLQLSAYKQALVEMKRIAPATKLAILQVGYRKNKDGFKFTPIDDIFPLFLAARQIWEQETNGEEPKERDYPLSIKLGIKSI